MDSIKEISNLISKIGSENEVYEFISELLTESEISTLSKRWRILKMLSEGRTQRKIKKELNVSLCKVTRGSRILKDENAIVYKLIKEN